MTQRRDRIAWCLFDFANSAFNTVIITFVYALFFKSELVGDQQRGDALWSYALTTAGLLVAVLSPLAGGWADRSGRRRELLILSSLVTIVATALLYLPRSGGGELAIWSAWSLVTVANVGFELAFVFYNSFLPQLGDARTVGRLSGYGWALGYVGGLLCLVVALFGFVGIGKAGGWFGISQVGATHVRSTTLLVAGWFAVFALPMFLFVREPSIRAAPTAAAGPGGLAGIAATLRSLRQYPDLLRLFIARLFYNDGLMAIIGLAALYMGETLAMPIDDVLIVGIWLNVAAGFGALAFGFVDDRFGAKPTILASLVLLIGGAVLAFAIPTVEVFWVAATMIGLGMGPNQSASRTLLARLTDPRRSAEFYGLFALSGKATVWIGPLLFGLIRPHFEDQRVAFAPIVCLMLVGFLLMFGLDERRGVARAREGLAG